MRKNPFLVTFTGFYRYVHILDPMALPHRKLENAGQRLGEETGSERGRGDPVRASPRATLPKSCSRGGTLLAARREVKGNCPNGGRSGSMRGGRLGGYQPCWPFG